MPIHSFAPISTAVLLGAVLASAVAGCSSTVMNPGRDLLPLEGPRPPASQESLDSTESSASPHAAHEATSSDGDALLKVLAKPHWIRSVRSADGEEPANRWIYPALDSMLSEEESDPLDLRPYLKSPNPTVDANSTVVANGAICLLRMGDSSVADHVAKAVGDKELDIKVRCAAAETLGMDPAGISLLQHLVEQEEDRRGRPDGGGYSPDVHGELIRALGRQVQPADEPRLVSAFAAENDEVKLAALAACQQTSSGSFPEQGLVLRNHHDPRIRVQLLLALARHPSDDTFNHLTQGLSDPDLRVRSAAIRAMGTLREDRAVARLEQILASGVEGERIAAVWALADQGEAESVAGGAGDPAWRVRLAVAEVLPELPGDPDVRLARKLLDDSSAEVQHVVVTALQSWPPVIAEPLLLDAIENCPYRSQKLAAELLATTWEEGRPLLDLDKLPLGQPPKARASALAEIRRLYGDRGVDGEKRGDRPAPAERSYSYEEIIPIVASLHALQSEGANTPNHAEAIASLRGVGPSLMDLLETLVAQRGVVLPDCLFEEVLAVEIPEAATVERLRSGDVQVRRRAARQLAEDSARRPLRPLLLGRLADVAVTETDGVVWQYLLAALAEQSDRQAYRLVYAGVGHNVAAIRQVACEHLGRHPRPEHAPVLLTTLQDPSVPVACAAVEALGGCGGDFDVAPILSLLGTRSESVRIAAAVTLAQLGRSEGPAALERLAYSTSEQTRIRVAQAMGDLALPEFAPTLIRLLDDRHGIRLAALRSLPRVADCEAAEAGDLRESERVEAWRRWGARDPKPI